MRIEAGRDGRHWKVVQGPLREPIRNVAWVDDDCNQWGSFSVGAWGVFEYTHCVDSIRIDEELLVIEIDCPLLAPKRKQPEIPPEVHNRRPINADTCIAAVRDLCRGIR
jgi:hypothetical protein